MRHCGGVRSHRSSAWVGLRRLDRGHRGLHGDEAHRRAVLAPKVCPTGKAQGRSGAEDGKEPTILSHDGKRLVSIFELDGHIKRLRTMRPWTRRAGK